MIVCFIFSNVLTVQILNSLIPSPSSGKLWHISLLLDVTFSYRWTSQELETDGERITLTTNFLLFLTRAKHKAQRPKEAEIFPQQRSGTFRLLRGSKSACMELLQSPGILRCAGEMSVQDFRSCSALGSVKGWQTLSQRHFVLMPPFLSDILIHTAAREKWDLNSSLDHLAWASTWIRSAVIVLYSSLISKSLKPENLKWVFPFWNRK